MLNAKNKTFHIKANSLLLIDAADDVVCFRLHKGKRSEVMASGRRIRKMLPIEADYEIVTKGLWSHSLTQLPPRAETPDQTPVEITIDKKSPSLKEELRDYVRELMQNNQENMEHGTFEDENDFDIADDIDPISPYEMTDMVEDNIIPITETPVAPSTPTSDESDTTMAQPEQTPPDVVQTV